MKGHLASYQIKVSQCDELSIDKTGKTFRSYHLKVNVEDAEKMWNDDIWPEFAIVRAWRGMFRTDAERPSGVVGNHG